MIYFQLLCAVVLFFVIIWFKKDSFREFAVMFNTSNSPEQRAVGLVQGILGILVTLGCAYALVQFVQEFIKKLN